MTTESKAREQLQEIYRHLDHHQLGNMYMSYYGQLRAQEFTHAQALEQTIDHFHLRSADWYKVRFK